MSVKVGDRKSVGKRSEEVEVKSEKNKEERG